MPVFFVGEPVALSPASPSIPFAVPVTCLSVLQNSKTLSSRHLTTTVEKLDDEMIFYNAQKISKIQRDETHGKQFIAVPYKRNDCAWPKKGPNKKYNRLLMSASRGKGGTVRIHLLSSSKCTPILEQE